MCVCVCVCVNAHIFSLKRIYFIIKISWPQSNLRNAE